METSKRSQVSSESGTVGTDTPNPMKIAPEPSAELLAIGLWLLFKVLPGSEQGK